MHSDYFNRLLLFDYYDTRLFDIADMMTLELEACEKILASSTVARYRSNANIVPVLRGGRYQLHLSLVVTEHSYDCKLRKIVLGSSKCLAHRFLVDALKGKPCQLVEVTFRLSDAAGLKSSRILRAISIDGFEWRGCRFRYFASKDPGKQVCVFLSHWSPVQLLHSIPVDFRALSSVPLMASRLGLIFSSICEGLPISESSKNETTGSVKVVVVEDLTMQHENGRSNMCFTDGSGYISLDLARLLPREVCQGVKGNETAPLPACFQVRLLCGLGLFKGTLVTSSLLTSSTIVVRPSMLKVGAHHASRMIIARCRHDLSGSLNAFGEFSLDIVNTSRAGLGAVPHSHLNKHLALLLCECGVPETTLLHMLAQKAQILGRCLSRRPDDCRDCCVAEKTNHILDILGRNSNDDGIFSMLSARHDVDEEPYLRTALSQVYSRELESLLDLRIACEPAAYLMGVPDPLGVLLPGEVYIPGKGFTGCSKVLVTRFPLLRVDAVVLFEMAVEGSAAALALEAFFCSAGTDDRATGGIVCFSTAGDRPPVACMGGDYDGDMYFVCADERIVSPISARNSEACTPSHPISAVKDEPHHHRIGFQSDPSPIVKIQLSSLTPTSPTSSEPSDTEDSDPSNIFGGLSLADQQRRANDKGLGTGSNKSNCKGNDKSYLTVEARTFFSTPPLLLSDAQLGQALFWEYISACDSMATISEANIGRLSNAWMAAADRLGAKHAHTVLLADAHDAALSVRKHGAADWDRSKLEHLSWLLKQFNSVPHFMVSPLPSHAVRSSLELHCDHVRAYSGKFYKSCSILGRLYDAVREMCTAFRDLAHPQIGSSCFSDSWIRGLDNEGGGVGDELFFIIPEKETLAQLPDAQEFIKLDRKLRRPNAGQFLQLAQRLFQRFEDDVADLHGQVLGRAFRFSAIQNASDGQRRVRENKGLEPRDFKTSQALGAGIKNLRGIYRAVFRNLCLELVLKLHRSLSDTAADLASAVYEVSYVNARGTFDAALRDAQVAVCDTRRMMKVVKVALARAQKDLRVCWLMCGPELNAMKMSVDTKITVCMHTYKCEDKAARMPRVGDYDSMKVSIRVNELLSKLDESRFGKLAVAISFVPPN